MSSVPSTSPTTAQNVAYANEVVAPGKSAKGRPFGKGINFKPADIQHRIDMRSTIVKPSKSAPLVLGPLTKVSRDKIPFPKALDTIFAKNLKDKQAVVEDWTKHLRRCDDFLANPKTKAIPNFIRRVLDEWVKSDSARIDRAIAGFDKEEAEHKKRIAELTSDLQLAQDPSAQLSPEFGKTIQRKIESEQESFNCLTKMQRERVNPEIQELAAVRAYLQNPEAAPFPEKAKQLVLAHRDTIAKTLGEYRQDYESFSKFCHTPDKKISHYVNYMLSSYIPPSHSIPLEATTPAINVATVLPFSEETQGAPYLLTRLGNEGEVVLHIAYNDEGTEFGARLIDHRKTASDEPIQLEDSNGNWRDWHAKPVSEEDEKAAASGKANGLNVVMFKFLDPTFRPGVAYKSLSSTNVGAGEINNQRYGVSDLKSLLYRPESALYLRISAISARALSQLEGDKKAQKAKDLAFIDTVVERGDQFLQTLK